jgi:N-acetylmuramic acid 6-phosphate etherase
VTSKRRPGNIRILDTEQSNRASVDMDCRSSLEIARIINTEDAKVAAAVQRSLPQIAAAIDWIAAALEKGGRLIYVGTGTSGRIAALDAAECPPTFNTNPEMVQFIIAGGPKALAEASEASEDSSRLGRLAIAKKKPRSKDVIVGVAASGRTPFTIAALEYARSQGAKTIAVVCNHKTPLEKAAHIAIVADVGAEVIAGSTRMKAGTAQKMILNSLTTGAMTRLGYVYGNLMVNLHPKNTKLAERGINILVQGAGLERRDAQKVLQLARNDVPVALVMGKVAVTRSQAATALQQARGHVRNAIAIASAKTNGRAGQTVRR